MPWDPVLFIDEEDDVLPLPLVINRPSTESPPVNNWSDLENEKDEVLLMGGTAVALISLFGDDEPSGWFSGLCSWASSCIEVIEPICLLGVPGVVLVGGGGSVILLVLDDTFCPIPDNEYTDKDFNSSLTLRDWNKNLREIINT